MVSLVAVHGLRIPINFKPWKDPQSFGVKTWIADNPGQEQLWLKDFLPHDVQGLRVLLFGYNSNALKNNGQLQEAEDLAKEIWYERQNELGAKHVDTLDSYNTLALMYQEQGEFKEGAKVARYTLKSLRNTLKADDIIIQNTKRRLGTILQKLGEYSEAETLLREALDVYTDQFGPDDHDTLKVK